MFPSSGNFKSIHCPFYLEDECKRIYCHFRHVKNSNEKSSENTLLSSLEDKICSGLRIDKVTFDGLIIEKDDRIFENILNKKLKSLYPDQQKLLDEFRFPDTLKDIFDFTTTAFTTEENVKDSTSRTEQDDDIPLDEGPLKQFLAEDAKRSSTEQTNQNTLEKRHIIISCLEKIDKKEFSPRRVGIVQPRKFAHDKKDFDSPNDSHAVCTNEAVTQPADNDHVVRIKQEDDDSDSSDPEDYAEVDDILTQMELLNPQLFNSGKNKEIKPEPVDAAFDRNDSKGPTLLEMESSLVSQNESKCTNIADNTRCSLPRINPKSVQAINNEISNSSSSSQPTRIKSEQTFQNEFVVPVPLPTGPIIAAATIAEQNRLKNVFKNTICANIDQFFDLCDACRVYGTEIFGLLEPLLNYLIEKLNPEFNFEKLRQLHAQNMSLDNALPFISSCDHVANCLECHNLLLCSLAKFKTKKADKSTETITSTMPLRKIEADLHNITKEIISLGLPEDGCETVAVAVAGTNDEKLKTHNKRSSRDRHHNDRRYVHIHDRTEAAKNSSNNCNPEKRSDSSSDKRSSHSHSHSHSYSKSSSSSSSSSRHGHEKRKKRSQKEDVVVGKAKRRRSSSGGYEQGDEKESSNDNHGAESKKRKSKNLSTVKSSHDREVKRCKSVEIVENCHHSDLDDENDNLGFFPSSDSSSDCEAVVDSGCVDVNDSGCEEEKYSTGIEGLQPSMSTIKKRISHVNETNSSSIYRKPIVKKNIPTPAEVLFQRMEQSKKLQENTNESVSNLFNPGGDKIRISHVPNVALMLKAKERLKTNLLAKPNPVMAPSSKTIAQSVAKGSSRIAHTITNAITKTDGDISSNCTSGSRPVISSYKATNNIPLPTRQNGLDRLFNTFAKKIPIELASELALKEEQTIHEKVTITKVYLNSLAMAIHRISKEDPATLTVKNSEYPTELNGLNTYELVGRHVLTYEQLEINGFPLGIPSMRGCCKISTKAIHYKPLTCKRNGDRFYCQQCKDLFDVDPETGIPQSSKGCKFHQFRPRKEAGRTRHDMYYPCCNKSITESGCMSAKYHTPDTTDDDCLKAFVETRNAPPGESSAAKTFYALDCEMCYTTVGVELTRVTVIGPECTVVYDSLVKPKNKILDYCTKFSGITAEKLRNVNKTLEQVREELFKFIFKDTILIGHSLENDLKALKILHYKVVDTSVMFPHRDAPERKFALKQLSSQIAQYLIQDNDSGHDSEEDARACMKLVWKKIREDAQVYKPRKIINSPMKQK